MSDRAALGRIICDPDVMKSFGTGAAVSEEEVESVLAGMLKLWEKHEFGRLAVVHKESGELIGVGGFRVLEGLPELNGVLAKGYWNLGLATEAGAAGLQLGFESLGFDKVVAVVKPRNIASRRVLKKLGMGFIRRARYSGADVLRYEITREQYQNLYREGRLL